MCLTKVTHHDVDRLARIAGWGYCQYHNYKVLFDGYDGNKPRYENIAPNALGYLASALKEHVILQVCKLSDPLRDHRGNENLSIQFFVKHAEFSDPVAKHKLERLAEKLETFGKKLRPARDKIISHFDRKTIHDGKPLGAAEPEEWKGYWFDLEQFVEILYERYFNTTLDIRQPQRPQMPRFSAEY
jgi:AbiU2